MSLPNPPPQVRRARRRWCQFGVASLLVATAVAALLVVVLEVEIERGIDWLRNLVAKPQPAVPALLADEVTVSIDARGAISVDGKPVAAAELPAVLRAAFQQLESRSKTPRAHVTCGADVPYVQFVEILDTINQAGFTEVRMRAGSLAAIP